MRVAHITDLHVERVPSWGELFNKRFLGAVNLYVLGRRSHFAEASQRALVEAVVDLGPDAVVCTGDLTATATEAEFTAAAELLRPLTDRFPLVVIPGNHDVYTGESVGRFAATFGRWSGVSPFVQRFGAVDFITLDVSRPALLSTGHASVVQLAALDDLLASGVAPAILLIHYPLRGRTGQPYGPATRNIENAAAIEGLLQRHPRVRAVLHGHEHHGYHTRIPRVGAPLDSYNPGASGYAYLPDKHRTAHFNLYTLDDQGIGAVERFAFDGARFAPEPGGAYATGG